MTIEILLAKLTPEQSEPLKRLIEVSLNQNLPALELHVTEVRTLADLIALAPQCNIIITGLHLLDAGPDEIIAAIPTLPEPVLVVTDIPDSELHVRCRLAKAIVIDTTNTRYRDLCLSITGLISQAIVHAATEETS